MDAPQGKSVAHAEAASGDVATPSGARVARAKRPAPGAAVARANAMSISMFGLGYVGAVSLACLARDGHRVIGVDVDPEKLAALEAGRSPIVEQGIQELTRLVVRSRRVSVTGDVQRAIAESDLSFICVGTPAGSNGNQDLSAIRRVCEQIGEALRDKDAFHVIVVRSTVRPGTVEEVVKPTLERHSGKEAGRDFTVCFQPEFLREGSSIRDYDNPPFTVVGCDDARAERAVRSVFGHLPCDFVRTSVRTAEMLKYACNAFHAVKVAFANEIGRVSQSIGVDSHEVMRLLCLDRQLNTSSAYLQPGFAFGGSCLPKDLKALLYLAKSNDVNLPLLGAAIPSNRVHIDHAIDLVLASGARNVALVGLSFKSGTDDLRESPMVVMAERLIGKGLHLQIFDPDVNMSRLIGANKRYIEDSIPHIASLMTNDLSAAVASSEVVVAGLKTPEVVSILGQNLTAHHYVVDLTGLPESCRREAAYHGLCW